MVFKKTHIVVTAFVFHTMLNNPRHVFNKYNYMFLVRFLDDDSTVRCAQIKCPALNPPNCDGVTPPGACCKVCGR